MSTKGAAQGRCVGPSDLNSRSHATTPSRAWLPTVGASRLRAVFGAGHSASRPVNAQPTVAYVIRELRSLSPEFRDTILACPQSATLFGIPSLHSIKEELR